jgi:hypothetical protein
MPIPPLLMAHFLFIQPDLLLGQFKGFFHLPPAASRSHDLFQAHRGWGEDEVVGDLGGIRQATPGEEPLLPARLRPAEIEQLPGPIVAAWPLTALPC